MGAQVRRNSYWLSKRPERSGDDLLVLKMSNYMVSENTSEFAKVAIAMVSLEAIAARKKSPLRRFFPVERAVLS